MATNDSIVPLTGKTSKKSKKADAEKIPTVKAEIVKTDNSVSSDIKNMQALDRYTNDILNQVSNISKSFCKIGYCLWKLRKDKLYLSRDFKSLGDYAESVLHIKKSSAYNYIKVCERFSKYDGHGFPTANLKDSYTDFNFTQLSEILYLPEKAAEEIKSDMTVSEIRNIRKKFKDSGSDFHDDETALLSSSSGHSEQPLDDCGTLKDDIVFSGVLTAEFLDSVIEKISKYVGVDVNCIISYKDSD